MAYQLKNGDVLLSNYIQTVKLDVGDIVIALDDPFVVKDGVLQIKLWQVVDYSERDAVIDIHTLGEGTTFGRILRRGEDYWCIRVTLDFIESEDGARKVFDGYVKTHKIFHTGVVYNIVDGSNVDLTVIPANWFLQELTYVHTDITYAGDTHEPLRWKAAIQHQIGGRLKEGVGETPQAALQVACNAAHHDTSESTLPGNVIFYAEDD